MITLESIQLLNVGDTICEPFISVRRMEDTKTGKPKYICTVDRDKSLFKGSMGAHSPEGALKNVVWYRNGLKPDRIVLSAALICPEREHGCAFQTKSERVFVKHLEQEHAMTPHQIGREIARQVSVR